MIYLEKAVDMPYRGEIASIIGPFITIAWGMLAGLAGGLGIASGHATVQKLRGLAHLIAYLMLGGMVGGISAAVAVWSPWIAVESWEGLAAFSGMMSLAVCLGVGLMQYVSKITISWRAFRAEFRFGERSRRRDDQD